MTERVSRVRFAADVVVRVIDREAVVVHLGDEQAFSLNETGARVAAMIAEGASLPAMVERLSAEYGQSVVEVREAVDALVAALLSKGLVRVEVDKGP